MNEKQKIVAVIGGGECSKETEKLAYEVGKRLAEFNFTLVCGGLGGVMEFASKGAFENGGTTIGILPSEDVKTANPYIKIPIATGMGIGRNIVIIRTAQIVVAIDGKFGTLSEIAFALQLGKPVFSLGSWEIDPKIKQVEDVDELMNEIGKLGSGNSFQQFF
ncbi:MAG: TIGR00725 family protein [Calditrichaeota bacterium]|nr:MAG: TIGR00725 family protein [Calditrichota bacterium]